MPDVAVLEDPVDALVALEPVRARLLAELASEPSSAAGVAARLGMARQNVGYHLNALAERGLVVEVGRRRHGGITERVFAASARSYVVSPAAMGPLGADPARVADRLSASYLLALAARAVREVGALVHGATAAGQRLPTLSIDVDIRLASAAERAAFAEDLAAAVRALAARYHDESAPAGRWYRLVALAHPPRPHLGGKMTEQRAIELAVDVDGTPEEVWEAIATGPGVGSWFIPTQIDGRPGGEVVMDFGTYGKETGEVTVWEPPRRFVYSTGGDRPLAFEWIVEARDGGRCTVRFVNSGFATGEEWDADFDGMSGGWRIFLDHLRLHLAHFRGRQARATVPTAVLDGPNPRAWASLCAALGVPEDLAAGQRLVSGGDAPPLSATVVAADRSATASVMHLLLDEDQGTGFIAAEGAGEHVACSVYLYRYDQPSGPSDPWTPWMAGRFPPMEAPLPGPAT